MILPKNGKVVIIDDEYEEVSDLILALKKEGIPFLFFEDRGGDDLPENGPIDDVRLVFLDLDLGLGGNNATEKIRIIQGRLVKIIKPKSPYALVIWSSHEDKFKDTLLAEFEADFRNYKPIALCSLEKSETLKEKDVVGVIRSKLRESLKKFEAFNAFLLWESIVGKSSAEIVNGFTQIFKLNDSWNNNVLAFFYRLAKANVGKIKINEINDKQKLQLALETITLALTDSVETNIKLGIDNLDLTVKEENANITNDQLIAINTKLHLINSDQLDHFQPGNVYLQDFADEEKVEDIVKYAFDKKKVDEIIASNPRTIKVDVTPGCDYSQEKGYTRFLSGILVDYKYFDKQKNPAKASIYSLCPVLDILGSRYYAVFDFRYFKSMPQKYVKEYFKKPEFCFRSQLLIDLQSGLSNHINRPGIVSIS